MGDRVEATARPPPCQSPPGGLRTPIGQAGRLRGPRGTDRRERGPAGGRGGRAQPRHAGCARRERTSAAQQGQVAFVHLLVQAAAAHALAFSAFLRPLLLPPPLPRRLHLRGHVIRPGSVPRAGSSRCEEPPTGAGGAWRCRGPPAPNRPGLHRLQAPSILQQDNAARWRESGAQRHSPLCYVLGGAAAPRVSAAIPPAFAAADRVLLTGKTGCRLRGKGTCMKGKRHKIRA